MESGRADETVPGFQLDMALPPPDNLLVLQWLLPHDLLLVGLKCGLWCFNVCLRWIPMLTDWITSDPHLPRPQDWPLKEQSPLSHSPVIDEFVKNKVNHSNIVIRHFTRVPTIYFLYKSKWIPLEINC